MFFIDIPGFDNGDARDATTLKEIKEALSETNDVVLTLLIIKKEERISGSVVKGLNDYNGLCDNLKD